MDYKIDYYSTAIFFQWQASRALNKIKRKNETRSLILTFLFSMVKLKK
jgi:hypothetical protein